MVRKNRGGAGAGAKSFLVGYPNLSLYILQAPTHTPIRAMPHVL